MGQTWVFADVSSIVSLRSMTAYYCSTGCDEIGHRRWDSSCSQVRASFFMLAEHMFHNQNWRSDVTSFRDIQRLSMYVSRADVLRGSLWGGRVPI